jgi:uncharacterized membrane protein
VLSVILIQDRLIISARGAAWGLKWRLSDLDGLAASGACETDIVVLLLYLLLSFIFSLFYDLLFKLLRGF